MLVEKVFDTGDVTINYAEGPQTGPPLVLLHGNTGNWQGWEIFLPHLTPQWHLYACDLRGHGKSGRVADRYRLTDYVQDIVAFLDHQVSEPAVLLGHSLGALTVIGAAAQLPTRVRALVLLDPPLCARQLSVAARPESKGWFSWVYDTVTAAPSDAEVLSRCRAMAPDLDEADIQVMAELIQRVAPDSVAIVLQDQLLVGFDLADALQHVKCPTLLLRGDWNHGATIRDEDAEFVHDHLPRATIVKMANGSHTFPWEQTETTVQHIQTFLQSVSRMYRRRVCGPTRPCSRRI
jgi:pimeloyl-ACP methyl ester carboxylesterase